MISRQLQIKDEILKLEKQKADLLIECEKLKVKVKDKSEALTDILERQKLELKNSKNNI